MLSPSEKKDCCSSARFASCREAGYDPQWNKDACAEVMSDWCSDAIESSECKKYCVKNPGECDIISREYCELDDADETYCSCLLAELPSGEVKTTERYLAPRCYNAKCMRMGYQTKQMNEAECPDIINCEIQADMTNNGITLRNNVELEQNCGDMGLSKKEKLNESSGGFVFWVILIVFIILVAVSIIGYWFITRNVAK